MPHFNRCVLIVDDDEQIRRTAEGILRSRGYEVRTAGYGFEALALMRKVMPDVIITDLKMPNMSGFEFLSIVRRRFPQTPTIAITGEFINREPKGVLADAFFNKGEYQPEQLFRKIEFLLQQAPMRPPLPKPDRAPVWIPRNGKYIVLTCSECLRSFSVNEDEAEQAEGRVACLSCDMEIRYALEPRKLS